MPTPLTTTPNNYMPTPLTPTRQFQNWLTTLIEDHNEMNACDDLYFPKGRFVEEISSYENIGTLLVKLSDGTEFQITIN